VRGNALSVRRGSGHLVGPGRWPDTEPVLDQPFNEWTEAYSGQPAMAGVYMGQHLSLAVAGKAVGDTPGSEPDSGNPTVRDRRGACGTVAIMGAGLRASGKPLNRPPDPTVVRAPYFYPDQTSSLIRD